MLASLAITLRAAIAGARAGNKRLLGFASADQATDFDGGFCLLLLRHD